MFSIGRKKNKPDVSVMEPATETILEAVTISSSEVRHGGKIYPITKPSPARMERLRGDGNARASRWLIHFGCIYTLGAPLAHFFQTDYHPVLPLALGLPLTILGVLVFIIGRPIAVYAVVLRQPKRRFNKLPHDKVLVASTDVNTMSAVAQAINETALSSTRPTVTLPAPGVVVSQSVVHFGSYFVRASSIKTTTRSLAYSDSLKARLAILALLIGLILADPILLGPHFAAGSFAAIAQSVFIAIVWLAYFLLYLFFSSPSVGVDWIGTGSAAIPIYASPSSSATGEIMAKIIRPKFAMQQLQNSERYRY